MSASPRGRTLLTPESVRRPDSHFVSPGVAAADWVFASAQLPIDSQSGRADHTGQQRGNPYNQSILENQTRQVLANVGDILRAGGCDLSGDGLRIQWWLASNHPTYAEFEAGSNWTGLPDLSPLVTVREEVITYPQPASTGIGIRSHLVDEAVVGAGLMAIRTNSAIRSQVSVEGTNALPDTPAIRVGDWIHTVGLIASDWQGDFMADKRMGDPSFLAPEARTNPYVWLGARVESQVDYILANAEALAEAAGTSLDRAVRAEVFIGHPADQYELDRAWKRWFGARGPARVVVPYSGLAGRGIRVEIAILFLAGDANASIDVIETSDAPQPLGPAPQAVRVKDLLFFSQQTATDSAGEVPNELTEKASFSKYLTEPACHQTEFIIDNVTAISEAAGTTLDNLCWRNTFLGDMHDLPQSMEPWAGAMQDGPPAGAALGLGARWPVLAPDARVLYDLISYVPSTSPAT